MAAKGALEYAPVRFTGVQARAIGVGYRSCVERSKVTIWACAVLPDHVHLVVAAHRLSIETLAGLLKGAATTQLVSEGVHPFQGMRGAKNRVPPCFARKWWVIFKDDEESVVNAIKYTERNPLKARLPAQKQWTCVTTYPEQYSEPMQEKK